MEKISHSFSHEIVHLYKKPTNNSVSWFNTRHDSTNGVSGLYHTDKVVYIKIRVYNFCT